MATMTQTGMIAASLALLVYIAVVITGSSLIPRQGEDSYIPKMPSLEECQHE